MITPQGYLKTRIYAMGAAKKREEMEKFERLSINKPSSFCD
jgi:hypothetical protein